MSALPANIVSTVMAKVSISPEEGAELQQLYADYFSASQEAANALRTGGEPLEGEALRNAVEKDAKISVIVRRIKEIKGE